ncbi:MAG: protein-S-isoprenylcysteine O-methyltransferase Ste14 [Rhodothermales bacterium]|jgi:protein-S-isoprenylcysteine O-methyltransferase Ste14
MSKLELKIPPAILAGAALGLIWMLRELLPNLTVIEPPYRTFANPLFLAGASAAAVGILQFVLARTTVNPHNVDRASSLVTGGIYRVSRNPMYLGIALILAGFVVYLGNIAGILAVAAFVAYMNRFQIEPEERVMAEKFGDAYASYQSLTRRWI